MRYSLVVLLCLGATIASAGPNPYMHPVAADGTAHFEFSERINHPHFWWPRTLLNYHVVLTATSAPADHWSLRDEETGQPVPVQVSDIRSEGNRIVAATVSFFSDLPTGGYRSFLLRTTSSSAAPAAADEALFKHEGSDIILDTGAMKVRLPGSQSMAAGSTAPGPIMAVNDGKGWVGQSSIDCADRRVRKLTTEILDEGPLFARARVTYDFDGGARYSVTIKAPRGYSFVEFTEEFSGLAVEDKASFHFYWTGLPLTNRRGDELIDRPHTIYYRGEDPHFSGLDHVENPADEFYYWLGQAAADSTTFVTSADFSNSNTGRAVGLCVLDGSKWDDGEYSIWASSDTQSVKFRYRDGTLEWLLPLAGKSRQLGIAAYNLRDARDADDLSRFSQYKDQKAAAANKGVADKMERMSFINSRYGGMGLDVVKEWELAYPDTGRRSPAETLPAEAGHAAQLASLDAYLKALWSDNNNEMLHVEGNWFSPVSLRIMRSWVVPGFCKYRDQMTPDMRARVTALLLFQSYLAAREEISPMVHMLKGHPNFMGDWKYPLMAGAYFFPDHPMAKEWADQFEKFVELAGIFYVRPEVKSWEARGGRWTESIATYNWAFIDPVMRANELGLLFDGRDRIASAGMAMHADYLSRIVTAPVKLGSDGAPFDFAQGTPLLPQYGFQRIHPPQGAHGGRRAIPGIVESFGDSLMNFDPMAAEHLLWINRRPAGSANGFEGDTGTATARALDEGTNPRLRSAKYTGYGIVLRAAVDTPDEISVYLQQIDKGPNYRWGFGNENGGGDIYYYAGGNSYSGHFGEDAGDRRVTDAEETCNTGVYKDSTFRGIGMNDLTEPFYDLGSAQFAEILARPGPDAYSWPEYESRSVMLVGHDYIIAYDAMNDMSRVSWNTVKGEDKMPTVIPISGENAFRTTQTSVGGRGEVTEGMRLEPYKGGGDRMTLVSHRQDLKVINAISKAGRPGSTFSEVISPEGNDFIYQQRVSFHSDDKGRVFTGRAGVIRQFKDGRTEMNLFHGELIGTRDLQLAVDNPSLGISATFKTPGEVSGQFFSREGGNLTLTLPAGVPQGLRLFVNGAPVPVRMEANKLTAQLHPGVGSWQLSTGPAVPMAPEITHSVARTDGATIQFTPVASADGYRIECSRDGGLTWAPAGTSKTSDFTLAGIEAPKKVHLRVIALDGDTPGLPGKDYPVYVTGKPVGPPDGLRLALAKDEATASWGEVLGAKDYVLYRRKAGALAWQEIYRGAACSHLDKAEGILPAATEPGLQADALKQPVELPVIYEYAVSAADAVGESGKSQFATTDPASWRNWYPDIPLRFKRRSAYWLPPYVAPSQVPPATYPR
jgi:hypothetical protein